jgi:tetratricopeptide (TPR) repeat protein
MNPILPALAQLEAGGLLGAADEADPGYRFRHALIQDAAYASLLRADRRRLHGVVGATLEALYPERRSELAPVLATHFAEAGDEARALAYFVLAGQEAAAHSANAEAAGHYRRALDLALAAGSDAATLIDLYSRWGRTLELGDRYPDALTAYAELSALGERRADQTMILAGLIDQAKLYMVYSPFFEIGAGLRLAHTALALARQIGDRASEARVLWTLLVPARVSEEEPLQSELVGYGEESLRIARELGLREQMAQTLNDLSLVYGIRGEYGRAAATGAEAQTLWRELGNLPMLTDALTNSAVAQFEQGHYWPAMQLAEEAYTINRRTGNRWGLTYSGLYAGRAYFQLGEWGLAIARLEEAMQMGAGGFEWGRAQSCFSLAQLYRLIGARERFRQKTEELQGLVALRFPVMAAIAMHLRLYLALHNADLEFVRAQIATPAGADLLNRFPMSRAILLAEFAAIAGDWQAALQQSEAIIALVSATFPVIRIEGLIQAGTVQLQAGQATKAAGTLAYARKLAEEMESDGWLWAILGRQYEAALALEQPAATVRAEAQAAMLARAAALPDDDRRAAFLALPQVRTVLDGPE